MKTSHFVLSILLAAPLLAAAQASQPPEKGMVPLHVDGFEKVKAGITTIDEVLRVSNLTA